MQPQGESIWGNINLCIEIALDIYFMIGENGEGIVVPKERAEEVFSEKTVEAGKEADGCLYYPKGDTMEMPLYEMMQKRAALARKMEIAAAKQMEQIRGNGSGAADSLFAKIAPPAETEYVICCARDGIYLTGGNEMQLLVAEQLAEHFLTPYACLSKRLQRKGMSWRVMGMESTCPIQTAITAEAEWENSVHRHFSLELIWEF